MIGRLAKQLSFHLSISLRSSPISSSLAHRVDKVCSAECTGDERRAGSSGAAHGASVANVAEDLCVAETPERELDKIGVGREIFQSVQETAEKTIGIVHVCVAIATSATGFDALMNSLANETR